MNVYTLNKTYSSHTANPYSLFLPLLHGKLRIVSLLESSGCTVVNMAVPANSSGLQVRLLQV